MINLGLFFEKKLQIGSIFLDGHTHEDSVLPARVTSSPVEYGANVVDNMVMDPIILNVTAFVSETPGFSLSINGIFNAFKRTSDALDVLRQAQVNRQTMAVYCNLGYFQNMTITSIRPNCDVDGITTISMDISFKEIIFVGEVDSQDPFDPKYQNPVSRGMLQLGSVPL